MQEWGRDHRDLMSAESFTRFEAANKDSKKYEDNENLRYMLLDFIADFANWDKSTNEHYLRTSRALTNAAHIANGGEPGTRPLVVDPFAGGGAIPLEALRVGADAFASDLNPVPVLLNKVVLEYIPKYGQPLADEVRKWGKWVKDEAEKELDQFYPKDSDGSTPIAYLWARTIQCEGPGCGAEVPLIRSLWLAKKGRCPVALRMVQKPGEKRVDFEIIQTPKEKDVSDGTVKRGSATCPCCGFTTPVASVRVQMKARKGGAHDARMFAVVTTRATEQGRFYRLPTEADRAVVRVASDELERRKSEWRGELSLVPEEPTPAMSGHRAVSSVGIYGMDRWCDLYTPRQLLTLTTLVRLVRGLESNEMTKIRPELLEPLQTILGCAINREAEHSTSLCRWNSTGQKLQATFGRQAIPMLWDFCETNVFGDSVGSWESILECVLIPFETASTLPGSGQAVQSTAICHPLPDDSANAFITDPPYYDAVPYADLADFFYVWFRRVIGPNHGLLLQEQLTPKGGQAIVWHPGSHDEKLEYERKMSCAMSEGRRVLNPNGVGVVVFAHKSTAGWESQLKAMINAGWIVTASWPIDTEMGSRLNAMGTASLASSIHLVCHPRENADGSVRDEIGDWRDVLRELPVRIHEWMRRLAEEGVVGADAIFACLGPALEIFSRYSTVEKPSGETVALREYLEHIWAAVAKEALNMIFAGADATGFEEDARLTAMWLWTLFSGTSPAESGEDTQEDEDEEQENGGSKKKASGYILEYDAARKIAQGLGANLEDLDSIIEVKGDKARLLPVGERARELFGFDSSIVTQGKKKKPSKAQANLFAEMEDDEYESAFGVGGAPTVGVTTLDKVHQSMLLFGAGRGETVKRFLVDDGVGNDERFWRLANALSALYPSGSQEKRWVDGILARKKGLGF